MKRGFIIALITLALGAGVFFLCYRAGTRPLRNLALEPGGEMVWLAREFQLDTDQAQRVAQLHADYEPRCMAMCRKIAANNDKLDRLITANQERTPEMEALLRESADIQVECRREMLAHIFAVASVMSPAQSHRYLALMKLQVLQPGAPHTFAPDVAHE